MMIVFRTDASVNIGTGHVMRCLALSDALCQIGSPRIAFISKELPENLLTKIKSKGFEVFCFDQEPVSGWQDDSLQTIAILKQLGETPDWLITDHYELDKNWQMAIRPYVRQLMAIDDLANRSQDCDILLDQNFYKNFQTRYDDLIPKHCRKLLGTKYALLRPEFKTLREKISPRDGSIRQILIFFGGSDPSNETEKALNALRLLNCADIAADVVVGGANPRKEEIRAICDMLSQTTFHCDTPDMAKLMAEADLAVGAGGTSNWERSCMGLPSLVITVAPNQEEVTAAMADEGWLICLGASENVTADTICAALKMLIRTPNLLKFMSKACMNLADGQGAIRTAQMIMPPELTIRRAELSDADIILQGRNADLSRRYSFNSDIISQDAHQRWYAKNLPDPNKILFIGERRGEPVGIMRYDLEGEHAEVSIFLLPGHYGKGYGSRLLIQAESWMKQHVPRIRTIYAKILAENKASLNAFEKAEFEKYAYVYRREIR
jgi:UDP-2,4-diacetamido-2,4,6-trideoxy-beta-L-altropyranose hydrolase